MDETGSDERLFGRLPPAEDGELDDEQRRLADQLHTYAVPFAQRAGFAAVDAGGRLIGPWNAQLFTPATAAGFNAWVAADQANSTLPNELREVAILSVAAASGSEYQLYAHSAAASNAGLSSEVVTAIRAGALALDASPTFDAVHRFATELTKTFAVSDATYARTIAVLSRQAVLDLTQLVSQYMAISAQLGAFAVGAPDPESMTPVHAR